MRAFFSIPDLHSDLLYSLACLCVHSLSHSPCPSVHLCLSIVNLNSIGDSYYVITYYTIILLYYMLIKYVGEWLTSVSSVQTGEARSTA